MPDFDALLNALPQHDVRALARSLSLVENELPGYDTFLRKLQPKEVPVIGITGPPGAGKSTLVNSLVSRLSAGNKRIGILAVDPSSPFNFGALLGDRIRMVQHFNTEHIFIRSVATRGSLGGLSDKIIEMVEVMKAADFDYLFVETVGVGQSEVEIAGIADVTVVVLVPEAGDSVQAMKAGLMEVADIFVVNKADRADADEFANNLSRLMHMRHEGDRIPILKTVATKDEGTTELEEAILKAYQPGQLSQRRIHLMSEKAYRILQKRRMADVDINAMRQAIEKQAQSGERLNLWEFAAGYS